MQHPPFVVAAAVAAASFTWAGRLAIDPTPYGPAPGAVLAISIAGLAVVCGAGILIARARWSRPLAVGLAAAALALGVLTPLHPLGIAGIALGGLALTGAAGPWLPQWLRRLPTAEGPSPSGVVAIFALLLLPAFVALARPDGFSSVDWTLVATPVVAWGLARSLPIALWAARIGLPVLGVAALLFDHLPSGVIVAIGCLATAAAVWQRDLLLAVSPIVEPKGPIPFPPELVSPDLLSAAGYDDRGRPREDG